MLKFVSFQQLFVELMEGSQKALAPWAMDNTPRPYLYGLTRIPTQVWNNDPNGQRVSSSIYSLIILMNHDLYSLFFSAMFFIVAAICRKSLNFHTKLPRINSEVAEKRR
jgi:hypothetical protein